MRPLKLKMQAFGTYIDECEIDFTEFGDRGLYLINGSTGAGKTTIFDAITYALYGRLSGKNRDGSMMRSKYADPSQETYVELEFECGGKIYTVRRNPTYERPKKNSSGTTVRNTSALLTLPDGRTIQKDVSETIENEILMLTVDQFRQTVMIAQGDYQKLLFATSKEREPLLRTLFGTERFDILRTRLIEEKKKAYGIREDIKKAIVNHAAYIKYDDGEELIETGRKHAEAANTEQLAAIVDQLTELGNAHRKELTVRKKTADEEYAEKLKSLQHMEECSERLRRITSEADKLAEELKAGRGRAERFAEEEKKLAEKKAALREEIKSLSGAEAELAERRSDEEKAAGRLAEAEELAGKVEQLSDARMDTQKKREILDRRENGKKMLEKQLSELAAETEQLRKRASELDGEEAKHTALMGEKEDLEKLVRALDGLKTEHISCTAAKERLEKAQKEYAAAENSYSIANERYSSLNISFLRGQAGILGEWLRDSEPCPVCGSLHHPKPAERGKDVPSEQELERAKAERDDAEKILNEKAAAAGRLGGEYETARDKLYEKSDELLGSHEDIPGSADKQLEDCEKKLSENRTKLAEKQALINERRMKLTQAEKNTELSKELSEKISAAERLCSEALSEIKTAEGKCGQMEKTLSEEFDSHFGDGSLGGAEAKAAALKETARKALTAVREAVNACKKHTERAAEAEAELEKLTADEKTASEKLAKLREELAAKAGEEKSKRAELEKLLEDPELDGYPDALAEKRAAVKELETLRKNIDAELGRLSSRILDNKKAAALLRQKGEELAAAEKRLAMVDELERTASGNVGGQDRVSFETYILQKNFRGMVEHANSLLFMMTDEHYKLKTSVSDRKSRKAGLDLELYDHWNDTSRDVRTLSGGESFLAALSLALGLSEEVQSANGGVRLDSMFVDEGFGTLDEESLDLVINALDTLSGENGSRLIGIISHVEELKNRITNQITITKDQINGSRAELSC